MTWRGAIRRGSLYNKASTNACDLALFVRDAVICTSMSCHRYFGSLLLVEQTQSPARATNETVESARALDGMRKRRHAYLAKKAMYLRFIEGAAKMTR